MNLIFLIVVVAAGLAASFRQRTKSAAPAAAEAVTVEFNP